LKKKFQIIIADDDKDDQEFIKAAIAELNSREDILTTSVYNGVELVNYLNDNYPGSLNESHAVDLILLDVNMPLMDGYAVLKRIKTDKRFSKIPVFVISTLRIVDKLDLFLLLGASNVYSKPNNLKGYKHIVEEILADHIYLEA
jgi:CheY-like chemotaxis protein